MTTVTLEDLKAAIDAVPAPSPGTIADGTHWSHFVYAQLRADAWRTAFEWRDTKGVMILAEDSDYSEGMRLIRERLS